MSTNTNIIALPEIPAAFAAVSTLVAWAYEATQLKPGTFRYSAAAMTAVDFGRVRHPRGIPL
ncbi:MAG: hypothetical protein QOE89_3843 [Pseudonocardiales bacterium]|nr:hypothetical protein [Pseudonocardiales bacterium]